MSFRLGASGALLQLVSQGRREFKRWVEEKEEEEEEGG